MDLIELLNEVEFKEQWRGYSTQDVDAFLAEVADEVARLELRVAEADEIRRTAAEIVDAARAEAASIVEVAKAERVRVHADIDALLAHARDQRSRLRAELQRQLAELDALQVGESVGGDATETFDVLAHEAADDDAGDLEWHGSTVPDDDDPFLAELRRAVNDDTPLGPRDHEIDRFRPHDDAPLPSARFRLRRHR